MSLDAVQELRCYCLQVITRNINEHSQLSGMTPRDLQDVCAGLSVDLPLHVALSLPLDDLYWRRRTQAHFPPPHVSLTSRLRKKGGRREGGERTNALGGRGGGGAGGGMKTGTSSSPSPAAATVPSRPLPPTTVVGGRAAGGRPWRQAYVEGHLSRVVCAAQDTRSTWRHLAALLQVCGRDVRRLHLPCLAPPPTSRSLEEGENEPGSLSHLDLSEVLTATPNIQELSVRYQSTQEGSGLVWGGVGASMQDLLALTTALTPSTTPHLTHLRIHESCVDDTRAERFLAAFRAHPNLACLDLRHNLLTCASTPHLADLLTSCPALTCLNLHHNSIGSVGGATLGAALARRPPVPLKALMLDLNPLGSKGGAALLIGAAKGGEEEEEDEEEEGKEEKKKEEEGEGGGSEERKERNGSKDEEEEAGAKRKKRRRKRRRRGLRVLSMAGCGLGDECWGPLTEALKSALTYVCLAANNFTQDPPEEVIDIVEGGGGGGRRGGGGGGGGNTTNTQRPKETRKNTELADEDEDEERGHECPRLLLTNLQGSTYLLGRVRGGRTLAPPLHSLREALRAPVTPAAAREDLQHYPPLHGVCLREQDFTLEEELTGMCLFTKEARQVLKA
ncbi:uncharacterized protein LOC127000898 [Eriocheir sinensis]|uniref:uncharacterized protein LOC127000898 n=1 Tax=Eriocheir sinensis TaxID=95602 RepID=UPI0021C6849E|nr:uncharacterized protein LOC127000898 [Eriocheir sinensis]